jgi:hypothetical protein
LLGRRRHRAATLELERQRVRYQQDLDDCGAIHKAAFPPPKLTEAAVKDLYAQELATKTCLEKLGIAVDPPISEQSCVDAYLSGKAPAWSAYANVDLMPVTAAQG